ncbi:MAG: hypothetical protein HYX92_05695 [Chloroflexi bacterium]|nr:hypothetical protein [Chloroflexota bacterium]
MTEDIVVKARPVQDPRGEPTFKPVKLAPRLGTLKSKRILFFDNGKLRPEFGNYGFITDRLIERFRGSGVGETPRAVLDLLVSTPDPIGKAISLLPDDVDGVVLGLADSGVTVPTVRLAAALEARGIPTAVLCTEAGIALAAAMAQSYVPGAPLSTVTLTRAATREEMNRQADHLLQEVIDGLTAPAERLKFSAQKWLAPMTLKSAGAGELALGEKTVKATRKGGKLCLELDPGAFAEEFYAACCESSLCDGFPVIPPTRDRVRATLRFTDRPPEHVLAPDLTPSGAPITVEKAAISAVMAGCRPEYFPVIVTAFEAMADTRYRLPQVPITSHPSGNAVVISGPLARELGIHAGMGCLGPGFRANATIGRALNLTLINVSRAIPGLSDLATQGSPAEYSYCAAENEEDSPWPAFHAELYGPETTSVTVHRCEGPHNIIDHISTTPESLLTGIASVAATLGGNNSYVPAELLVFLNSEHARIIADAGWSKDDVKLFLYDKARNPRELLEGRGIVFARPAWMTAAAELPVVRGPWEVLVFVVGGTGLHSSVGIPWAFSQAVTRPVAFKDGRPVKSVQEFLER